MANEATTNVSATPISEHKVLKVTFSSTPLIWQTELYSKYWELGEALADMTDLDEDDEWKIDADVQQVAWQISESLVANWFPTPRIFNHGPKSVVFNWMKDNVNLYLTISTDYVSALLSSPKGINRRIDFSTKNLMQPASIVRGLLSDHAGQPMVSTISAGSQTSEFAA